MVHTAGPSTPTSLYASSADSRGAPDLEGGGWAGGAKAEEEEAVMQEWVVKKASRRACIMAAILCKPHPVPTRTRWSLPLPLPLLLLLPLTSPKRSLRKHTGHWQIWMQVRWLAVVESSGLLVCTACLTLQTYANCQYRYGNA